MSKKDDKKIITVQLPTNLYEQLLTEAEDQMLTLSAYIRLLLIKNHDQDRTKN